MNLVNEIAAKLKLDEIKDEREKNKQEKWMRIWTGRTLRQFNLYDHQAGRKDKKRAYKFSHSHVEGIFKRYMQSNGLNGHMVSDQENQASAIDHSKNFNGQQWSSNGNSDGLMVLMTKGMTMRPLKDH